MAAPPSPGPSSPKQPPAALVHASSFSHRPSSQTVSVSEQRYSTGSAMSPAVAPKTKLMKSPRLDKQALATKPLPGLPPQESLSPVVPSGNNNDTPGDQNLEPPNNHGHLDEENASSSSLNVHQTTLPFPTEVTKENPPVAFTHHRSPSSPSFHPPQRTLPSSQMTPAGVITTNLSLKTKRSAASLRSIPERRSEDSSNAPPVPRHPSWVEGQTRYHSLEDGNASADSSQDSYNRSNFSSARSTRHSLGSQYAASAATSAWTPSSFGESRLGLDASNVRTSVTSRDSRLTCDSDLDEYFSKVGHHQYNSTIKRNESASWYPSNAASLFASDPSEVKSSANTDVDSFLSNPVAAPLGATLAALIDAEWGAQECTEYVIGLGITSDEAVNCTKESKSPNLSGVPGVRSRSSRSASLSGTLNVVTAPDHDIKSGSPSPPVDRISTSLNYQDCSRDQGLSASSSSQISPNASSLPSSAASPPIPRSPSAPVMHSKGFGTSSKDHNRLLQPMLPELNIMSAVAHISGSQTESNGDDGRTSKSLSIDWDEGCESPFVSRHETPDTSSGFTPAENGKAKIVDWSKVNGGLCSIDIPKGTTHLLLANTRSPLAIGSILHTHLPLIAETLVVLDVSYANLTSLPSILSICTALEELNVSGNPLSQGDLPSWLGGLTSLRVLVADSCNLSHLPHSMASLTSLMDLSLRDNHLRTLPSWMCHLSALDVLLVDGNAFHQPWKDLVNPLLSTQTRNDPPLSSRASILSYTDSIVDSSLSSPLQFRDSWTGSFMDDQRPHTAEPAISVFQSSHGVSLPRHDNSAPPSAHTSMRRMKSAGDLRSEQTHVTPPVPKVTLASLMQAEVKGCESDGEETSSAVILSNDREPTSDHMLDNKKSFGFLKKMSLGKLRPRQRAGSVGVTRRPSQMERIESTDAVPATYRKQLRGLHIRTRTNSQAISTQVEKRVDKRIPRRRSFLNLEQVTQHATKESSDETDKFSSPSEAIQTEEIASLPSSPKVDRRTALRSIMMYLQDVYDLSSVPSKRTGSAARSNTTSPYISRASSFRTATYSPMPDSEPTHNKMAGLQASDVEQAQQQPDFGSIALTLTPDVVDRPDRRRKVIEEIVSTEQSYARGLQELQRIYIQSASTLVPGIGSGISGQRETVVPAVERKAVFTNVEAIIGFHVDVLMPAIMGATASMSGPPSDGDEGRFLTSTAEAVAKVFIRNSAFLKLYSSYITQFNTALDHLRDWTTTSLSNIPSAPTSPISGSSTPPIVGRISNLNSSQKKRLRQWLKRCRSHSSHHQINLESYLLLPVQRLPRYRMLLENLAACTPGDQPEQVNTTVAEALNVISAITADMNERKRDSEGRQRLLYWQQRLGNRFRSPLVQPHRTLIKEGGVMLVRTVRLKSDEEHHQSSSAILSTDRQTISIVALLCTDLLVFCKDNPDGGTAQANNPTQLLQSIRLPTQARQGGKLPASIFGSDRTMIRYVDSRTIFYLQCPSRRAAMEWTTAINAQIPL